MAIATGPDAAPGTPFADVAPPRPRRRARNGRRAILAVLAVVVAAGAVGALGVHTGSAEAASADGWRLKVWYPQIARAGLDVES
jgi:hypothetical protein